MGCSGMDNEYRCLSNQSTGGQKVAPWLCLWQRLTKHNNKVFHRERERERETVLLSGSRTVTLQAQSGTRISRFWELNTMPFFREPPVIRYCTLAALRGPSSCCCHISLFATAGPAESHSYGTGNESWWVCKEGSMSSFSKLLHNREKKIDHWGPERVLFC